MGILINSHRRKIRAEEKASSIVPGEPSELENLLDNIIALEESADAESQELRAENVISLLSTRKSALHLAEFLFEGKFLVCQVLKWKILRSISLVKH